VSRALPYTWQNIWALPCSRPQARRTSASVIGCRSGDASRYMTGIDSAAVRMAALQSVAITNLRRTAATRARLNADQGRL
jgi:hypothetical protein